MKIATLRCLLVALAAHSGLYAAKTSVATLLNSVNRSVFEVVIPKPEADPLTYEKPLPLDLIPFKVRNDKYYPVGSAFAINETLLVTAAHVLSLSYRTQLQPHMVRDASGKVYGIRNICAFSGYIDAAAFTIDRAGPLRKLPVSGRYDLNSQVYAIGNALGEGIVTRDGLLTSTSPEPNQGLFDYLRFSAAASPGNSGGPLLNRDGLVIGMITGKSDNENLNYAVPISQVLGIIGKPGAIYTKIVYSLPNCNYQKVSTFQGEIAVPQAFTSFRDQLSSRFIDFNRAVLDSLVSENRDNYFPSVKYSEDLLFTAHTSTFPNLVAQRKDGTWSAFGPKEMQKFNLEGNGKLTVAPGMFNYDFFRIEAPDSIPLRDFYDDDKRLIDYLLSGIKFTRDIGNSETRITSLGAPSERSLYRDAYGRKWLVRSWLLPHSDEKVVMFALPVPQGLVGYMRLFDLGRLDAGILPDMYYLTDYLFISYYATLWRWKQFMEGDTLIPETVAGISIDYQPGKYVTLKTKRFSVETDSKLFKVTENSDLQLKCNYFLDGGRVVWDISGALFGEDKDNMNLAVVMRYAKPPLDATEDVRQSWRKAAYKLYPYDRTISISEKSTSVRGLHPFFEKMDPGARLQHPWLYSTSVQLEGNPGEKAIRRKLDDFNGFVTIGEAAK